VCATLTDYTFYACFVVFWGDSFRLCKNLNRFKKHVILKHEKSLKKAECSLGQTWKRISVCPLIQNKKYTSVVIKPKDVDLW